MWDNLKLLAVYRYPADLLWRPILAVGVILLLLGLGAGLSKRAGKGIIAGGVFWWFSGLGFVITLGGHGVLALGARAVDDRERHGARRLRIRRRSALASVSSGPRRGRGRSACRS
ncbi:MAG: hypothetical protein U5J97_05180 [Trueperaceae bacterium]|nr:hypothetical protein [Trueperaceae bacterium]